MNASSGNEDTSTDSDSSYKQSDGSTFEADTNVVVLLDTYDEEFLSDRNDEVLSPSKQHGLKAPSHGGGMRKLSPDDIGINVVTSRERYMNLIQSTIDKLDAMTVDKKSNSILVTRKKYKFIQHLFKKTLEFERLREEQRKLKTTFEMENKDDEEKATELFNSIQNCRIVDTFDNDREKSINEAWEPRLNWLQLFRLFGNGDHIKKFKANRRKNTFKERGNLLKYEHKSSEFQG